MGRSGNNIYIYIYIYSGEEGERKLVKFFIKEGSAEAEIKGNPFDEEAVERKLEEIMEEVKEIAPNKIVKEVVTDKDNPKGERFKDSHVFDKVEVVTSEDEDSDLLPVHEILPPKNPHDDDDEESETEMRIDRDNEQRNQSITYPKKVGVHSGITCSECGMSPILGVRYRCYVCVNYNQCSACECECLHPHPMIKIRIPQMAVYLEVREIVIPRTPPPEKSGSELLYTEECPVCKKAFTNICFRKHVSECTTQFFKNRLNRLITKKKAQKKGIVDKQIQCVVDMDIPRESGGNLKCGVCGREFLHERGYNAHINHFHKAREVFGSFIQRNEGLYPIRSELLEAKKDKEKGGRNIGKKGAKGKGRRGKKATSHNFREWMKLMKDSNINRSIFV